MPLSVSIISFNEEQKLGKLLEIVCPIAQEVILVDSFSQDNTLEIARSFGIKIFSKKWAGHIEQKNFALSQCSQDWILCLDCDEFPDNRLLQEIKSAVQSNHPSCFLLNRKTFYLGRFLNFAWQPDWNLRLVHRELDPIWQGKNPHDKLFCKSSPKKLKGFLEHYSYSDLFDHFSRMLKYSKISANSLSDEGKRFKKRYLIINPIVAFIRQFFLKSAYKDGIRGFLVASSTFISTFFKYAFLWELQRKK